MHWKWRLLFHLSIPMAHWFLPDGCLASIESSRFRPRSAAMQRKAYAVNSATLVRVTALREIGGYSDEFWLDLSDVYVFQAIHRKGKYMYVAGDLRVEHSIASMDFDKEMSPERYRNFMAAESAYIDLYLSPLEQPAQLLRLFVRTIRQYRRYENKIFSRITWEYFLQRLFLNQSGPAGALAGTTQETRNSGHLRRPD